MKEQADADEFDLEGKNKTKFLGEEWQRTQNAKLEKECFEREAEQKRLDLETTEKRLRNKREAEERRLEKEMEENRSVRETKLQSEKLAAKLEFERLQLERASVEREKIEARAEVKLSASSQAGQENAAAATKTHVLRGFERYASIAGWQQDTWAVRLSPLLTGKALDVYFGLFSKDARDYDKLRKALLQKYDFTEQEYCERFRKAKPEG